MRGGVWDVVVVSDETANPGGGRISKMRDVGCCVEAKVDDEENDSGWNCWCC